MAEEITVKFSSRAAAGAALAWAESNIRFIIDQRAEARRHGDRIFVRNATTEMAGLVAVKRAIMDAGIEKFVGHERDIANVIEREF